MKFTGNNHDSRSTPRKTPRTLMGSSRTRPRGNSRGVKVFIRRGLPWTRPLGGMMRMPLPPAETSGHLKPQFTQEKERMIHINLLRHFHSVRKWTEVLPGAARDLPRATSDEVESQAPSAV